MLQAFSRIDISEFTDINIIKGVADVYADIKKTYMYQNITSEKLIYYKLQTKRPQNIVTCSTRWINKVRAVFEKNF